MKNRTKKNSRKIFEELEFRTLIDRVLKRGSGNSSSPYSNLSGYPTLCRDSVCPAANLHSENSARFKAICLQICGRGDGRFENSNLTRLEMLDIDHQPLIQKIKKSRNYSKVTYKRNSLNRYRDYRNRANGRRTCRNELQRCRKPCILRTRSRRTRGSLKIVNEFRPLRKTRNP